jgi:hypothetical protein
LIRLEKRDFRTIQIGHRDVPPRKMMSDYPGWGIIKSLDDIFLETYESWRRRLG